VALKFVEKKETKPEHLPEGADRFVWTAPPVVKPEKTKTVYVAILNAAPPLDKRRQGALDSVGRQFQWSGTR